MIYERVRNLDQTLKIFMDFENNHLYFDDLYNEVVVKQTDVIVNIINDQSAIPASPEEMEVTKKIISTNLEGYYGLRK